MAWTVKRSVLGRYCPTFQEEYPVNVGKHDSDFLKMNSGIPLKGRHLPVRVIQVSKQMHLPDVLGVWGIWLVSEKFRSLVEIHEPGIHQFFPIEVFMQNGLRPPTAYSAFNICQTIDALIFERSSIHWVTRADGMRVATGGGGADDALVVEKSSIQGKHVWREKSQLQHNVFFSDTFKSATEESRIEKLRYYHVLENGRQ